MKGVVSHVTCGKVQKVFSLQPHFVSTREAASATCQAKLSVLVKEAWRYEVPFPRTLKLQTDRQTHTQNTHINIMIPCRIGFQVFNFHTLLCVQKSLTWIALGHSTSHGV